ncbi:uncharacterized protein FTOL_13279 [Fusarium torulosum]|uniref:Uncharacterized protein n=1 Tax=Fusarium torulosum TaxID=33205 RepID=A0AAE8MMB6_9HYPO|nr:uncharacterized protein FTOL_13279 [Fusarium torulosum]
MPILRRPSNHCVSAQLCPLAALSLNAQLISGPRFKTTVTAGTVKGVVGGIGGVQTSRTVSTNEDDQYHRGRSPLQRLKSYPKRPLTVSDLTSGAWYELQYRYTLTRLPEVIDYTLHNPLALQLIKRFSSNHFNTITNTLGHQALYLTS